MFRNRHEAGQRLAAKLGQYASRSDVLVLGLPRGGVPVAAAVAEALAAPLDVFLVRKLGVPGYEELAMGAIASGGVRVLNEDVIGQLGITDRTIDLVTEAERRELDRRERTYRDDRPPPDVRKKVIVLVDDGLATGATMRAAVEAIRRLAPLRVVVAVPIGAPETCHEFSGLADEVVCAFEPDPFISVSHWYEDFEQTTDGEVRKLLAVHGQVES